MAPASKSKAATNGNATQKSKAASSSGTATPVSTVADKKDTVDQLLAYSGGKPDKKVYDDEQNRLKAEIDALQVKLSGAREKINFATKTNGGNERQKTLRTELDSIRDQQSANKTSRGKVFDQIKTLQESVQKRVKDMQASKSKIPFKNVAELDARISQLDKQVESGNLKLAEEKRALQEISTAKRSRKTLEASQVEQDTIDKDKAKLDELRKELDDPEAKAVSERYDAIKAELDELKKESDEAYANRAKLFEERDNIQNEINGLYNQKRDSTQQYRDANDRYWTKVNEDRARRAERARQQRVDEENQRKKEIAERLLEEAQAPAFQSQVEDCQTLIDFFEGKNTGTVTLKTGQQTTTFIKPEVAGVPKLEIRQVEGNTDGLVALKKKKGEEQDSYFVGGKGKSKGKKGKQASAEAAPPSPSGALNLPLAMLTALLALSIPPPASNADLPRVVEDLSTKKAWFEANQARQTAENVARAQAEIRRLESKTAPNGDGEVPAEPVPTPADGPDADPVEGDAIADKLDEVLEEVAVEA